MTYSSDMIGYNIIIQKSIGKQEQFVFPDVQMFVINWNDSVEVIFQWISKSLNIYPRQKRTGRKLYQKSTTHFRKCSRTGYSKTYQNIGSGIMKKNSLKGRISIPPKVQFIH